VEVAVAAAQIQVSFERAKKLGLSILGCRGGAWGIVVNAEMIPRRILGRR
jgi:hypothetical protein